MGARSMEGRPPVPWSGPHAVEGRAGGPRRVRPDQPVGPASPGTIARTRIGLRLAAVPGWRLAPGDGPGSAAPVPAVLVLPRGTGWAAGPLGARRPPRRRRR